MKKTANYIDRHVVEAMVEVAKQKLYSEEEVIALIHRFNYDLVNSNIETFKDWFDENKK